jgi:uncharacterized protein (TIGR03437 family)
MRPRSSWISPAVACLSGIVALLYPGSCWSQGFTINTVVGGGSSDYACNGEAATQVVLGGPAGVAIDAAGNIYIADTSDDRICKVSGGIVTLIAGGGQQGYAGDGGPAAASSLNQPFGVAVDAAGNVYIADTYNNVIRKVSTTNIITTFAGNGTAGYAGDGGPAASAELALPFGVAVDAAGNVYIADTENHLVRKVSTTGTITTVAGNGSAFYAGDGMPATSVGISNVTGVAVDSAGNLYIATFQGFRVLKVTNGIVTTVAGNGSDVDSGDGGPATSAGLGEPDGVAVDSAGNVYIAEQLYAGIREVSNGTINTIAGNGTPGFSGDGGSATSAEIGTDDGIAVGGGKIYIADMVNDRIRVLTGQVSSQPPTVLNGGVASASAFGDFTAAAPGSWIEIYGSNLAVDSRSWATSDFNGANAPTSLDGTSVTIGGQSAFIDYISSGQVNAQVPSNVGTGLQQVIVKTAAGSSAPISVTINGTEPGLLAPPAFEIGGKQYVVALFLNGTYVLPQGAISGVTSQPAQPGQTITLYGVGFGPVVPNIPAGQIVPQDNVLAANLQISFAGTPATVSYSGLAPGYVGLYQFNVVVPSVPASNTVPLTFSLGAVQGTQTLYIAVQN